jgi:hypothetical protein
MPTIQHRQRCSVTHQVEVGCVRRRLPPVAVFPAAHAVAVCSPAPALQASLCWRLPGRRLHIAPTPLPAYLAALQGNSLPVVLPAAALLQLTGHAPVVHYTAAAAAPRAVAPAAHRALQPLDLHCRCHCCLRRCWGRQHQAWHLPEATHSYHVTPLNRLKAIYLQAHRHAKVTHRQILQLVNHQQGEDVPCSSAYSLMQACVEITPL